MSTTPTEPLVIAVLERDPDNGLFYVLRSDRPHPEHPHSPRFYGKVYGLMGQCGGSRLRCDLGPHGCDRGCVRSGPESDRTRANAQAMAAGLNVAHGHPLP